MPPGSFGQGFHSEFRWTHLAAAPTATPAAAAATAAAGTATTTTAAAATATTAVMVTALAIDTEAGAAGTGPTAGQGIRRAAARRAQRQAADVNRVGGLEALVEVPEHGFLVGAHRGAVPGADRF